MKVITFVICLLFSYVSFSQTKSEKKMIHKINKQILDKKIIKKNLYKKNGWAGGYDKQTVYLKNNSPILIEKEETKVMHLYLTNGNEEDKVSIIRAKFYITNWKKNKYIRVGEIIKVDMETSNTVAIMPAAYVFKFNGEEIEKLCQTIE